MYQLEEHIFLIGFMGVGKSTIARILSKMLGVREYDTDRMIVAREGREISTVSYTHLTLPTILLV